MNGLQLLPPRIMSISENADVYLEPYQTSIMELFAGNSQRLKAVNFFRENFCHRFWHCSECTAETHRTVKILHLNCFKSFYTLNVWKPFVTFKKSSISIKKPSILIEQSSILIGKLSISMCNSHFDRKTKFSNLKTTFFNPFIKKQIFRLKNLVLRSSTRISHILIANVILMVDGQISRPFSLYRTFV